LRGRSIGALSYKGSVEEIVIGFSRLWSASCGVAYAVFIPWKWIYLAIASLSVSWQNKTVG
jgi:hypothetical protein